jgi:hypothetical protein
MREETAEAWRFPLSDSATNAERLPGLATFQQRMDEARQKRTRLLECAQNGGSDAGNLVTPMRPWDLQASAIRFRDWTSKPDRGLRQPSEVPALFRNAALRPDPAFPAATPVSEAHARRRAMLRGDPRVGDAPEGFGPRRVSTAIRSATGDHDGSPPLAAQRAATGLAIGLTIGAWLGIALVPASLDHGFRTSLAGLAGSLLQPATPTGPDSAAPPALPPGAALGPGLMLPGPMRDRPVGFVAARVHGARDIVPAKVSAETKVDQPDRPAPLSAPDGAGHLPLSASSAGYGLARSGAILPP